MKLKTLFLGDTRSLFHNIRDKFPNSSLNYLDLIKKLETEHNLMFIFKAVYGKYEVEKCVSFMTMLRETGFDIQFDRKFYDADMAIKAALSMPHIDAIVLASCWHGQYSILKYAKDLGKITYIVGVDIPRWAHYMATPIEITEDLLRKKALQDLTPIPESNETLTPAE